MRQILIFFILFQSMPAIPQEYVEMLVKTSDNALSKLSRDQWTDEMRREHRAGGSRQGYIILKRPSGWDWGRMERDPKRFAVVSIPKRKFNKEWLEPIRDATGDVLQERQFRLPLESFISKGELDTLKARPYNDLVQSPFIFKTIEDITSLIIAADFNNMPTPWKSHGSSGLFIVAESGGDYTSLFAAEAGEDGDITGTGPAIFEVSGTWSGPETAKVVWTNWTTTPDDYIEIRSATDSRHNGVWDDTLHSIVVSNGDCFAFTEANIKCFGIQMNATATAGTGDNVIVINPTVGTNTYFIANNLLRGDPLDTDDWQRGIDASDSDINTIYVWNNIFFEFTQEDTTSDVVMRGNAATIYFYNNTVVGGAISTHTSTSNVLVAKNNIFADVGTEAMFGTYDSNSEFNSTDFSTLEGGGSGNRTSQTFTFVGETDNPPNYLLASGDGGAKDFGTDLSGDGNLPFDVDILGESRPDSTVWDMGAHEEGAGATPTSTPTPIPTATPIPTITPTPALWLLGGVAL